MKVSIKQAMKELTILDKEILKLLEFEKRESKVVYLKGEKPEVSDYNYQAVSKEIEKLETKKRQLKIKIINANANTKTEYKSLSISELLILLAQLSSKLRRLEDLASNKKRERVTTHDGQVEYTECLFEPKEVEKEITSLTSEITKIQIAIDRANLDTQIEV